MIAYRIPSCPQCYSRLRGGTPLFGPAQVRCGYCNTVVSTGLKSWSQLSGAQKGHAVIRELIAPTWLGGAFIAALLINMLILIATFMIPIVQVVKLKSMIAESNQAENGEIPIWNWLWQQRQTG